MAYTQAQLQNLQKALASGEQEVIFKGRKTVYRSVSELERAIADVQAGLAAQAGTVPVRVVKTYQNDENDC